MTKEELNEQKKIIASSVRAEAKEKGLSKADTDKAVKEAIDKLVAENPIKEEAKTVEEIKEVEKVKEVEYIVTAPVKDFNGEVAGVQFAYGKAKVKAGWVLDWFREKGYKVEAK